MPPYLEGGPLRLRNIELIRATFPLNASIADCDLFIADTDYEIVCVEESHGTAGSDGGAVTLDVKKATGTTAIASGTTMLASTFNLKSTANTPVRKNLSGGGLTLTLANRRLARGNRLGLDFSGTLTALANVAVQVWLRREKKRNW